MFSNREQRYGYLGFETLNHSKGPDSSWKTYVSVQIKRSLCEDKPGKNWYDGNILREEACEEKEL